MDNHKSKFEIGKLVVIVVCVFIAVSMLNAFPEVFQKSKISKVTNTIKESTYSDGVFRIISSTENKDIIDNVVIPYAKTKGIEISVDYEGTLDVISKINSGEKYDAVWISNSIWLDRIKSDIKVSDPKSTNINPVIFGIKKSKAEELGFVGRDISNVDIINAISEGRLKFSMSNPTRTNSGASAYLGLLYTLAGNPEIITADILEREDVKQNLKTFFSGLERSSGSEDYLNELFLNGEYEAVVTYESSIISINKELAKSGKETLYAVYPVDGVSISDSPIAYIDNGNNNKKEIYEAIKSFILGDEGQVKLAEYGRRTWYGGINANANKEIFNPDWGIDTTKYISPIKYPNTEVINLALNTYQSTLRKAIHVVFCLDYSGSMTGDGIEDLREAMHYILNAEEAGKDFIQFTSEDKIDIVSFESNVEVLGSTNNGTDTAGLLQAIDSKNPTGITALYPAAIRGIELLKDEDSSIYNTSIILMTDGQGNDGTFEQLTGAYSVVNKDIPIYSITFGQAESSQLEEIAELTNGKVFDGKEDLVEAFKEVRGYN